MKIGIFGAGAIGGYLGVRLSAGGADVVMIARRDLIDVAADLQAADLGASFVDRGARLTVSADPAALSDVDICLLTVKSRDTAAAGATLREVLRPSTLVVSLQNGLRNPGVLADNGLAGRTRAGMVTFNVVRDGVQFSKATSGPVMIEAGPGLEGLLAAFRAADEAIAVRPDIEAIQAGKLLLNLNNGICAATGLTVAESLRDSDGRWCFARCIAEGRAALRGAGRPVASIGILSPALIQRALGLPTFVFTRVAGSMMRIDPRARSSTLQDLERGKPTEIGQLNGEIVGLAGAHGLVAPVNRAVLDHVHRVEAGEDVYTAPSEIRRRSAV